MNTMDFSILNLLCTRLCGALLLSAMTAPAIATPPAPKTTPRHPELVLTLSDHWLAADSKPLAPTTNTDALANNPNPKQRAVNVDCGMDANPLATYDNSLGNRLQGECNLGYRY